MPPLQSKTGADIFTDTSSPPVSPTQGSSLKVSKSLMAVPPRPRTTSGTSSVNASPAPSPAASPRLGPRKQSFPRPVPLRRGSTGGSATGGSAGFSSNSESVRSRCSSLALPAPQVFDDIKSLGKAIKRSFKENGESHPKTGELFNQLGNMHFREGNLDAAAQSYKLAVQCEPGEHLSASYLNLGTVYWRNGNIEEAIHFLKQALSVHEVDLTQKGDNVSESTTAASVYHQLGVCYALKSDWKNALESLEIARAIRIQATGPMDVTVGQTNDAIGKVLCMQGKHNEAMSCHEQALSALRAAGITDTTSTLQNMANVHVASGRPVAALTVLQEVYKMQKEVGIKSKTKAALHIQTLQMMAKLNEDTHSPVQAERFRTEAEKVEAAWS